MDMIGKEGDPLCRGKSVSSAIITYLFDHGMDHFVPVLCIGKYMLAWTQKGRRSCGKTTDGWEVGPALEHQDMLWNLVFNRHGEGFILERALSTMCHWNAKQIWHYL